MEKNVRTNEQPDSKEIKEFLSKIWEQKEHKKKAKWINDMKKDLLELEEGEHKTGITTSNTQ